MTPNIQINPRICNGKPVIAGTRIPVTVILDQLIVMGSIDKVLELYPELSRDKITSAFEYCHSLIDNTEMEIKAA